MPKSLQVLLFNSKSDAGRSVTLSDSIVELVDDIYIWATLMGRRSILETLLSHFLKQSSFTYSCIVANERNFDRRLLAQVYIVIILTIP